MTSPITENKYVQPTLPKSGYSFVPAAILHKGGASSSFEGIAVYVKHSGGSRKVVSLKEVSENHIWLQCPDRELVIVRNSNTSGAFYPSGCGFEECYDFSYFSDGFSKQGCGLDYIMTNFVHGSSVVHPRREARTHPDTRVQVMSDSGGLQVARGRSLGISPVDLINFYNSSADAGMVLDVPLFHSDMEIVKKAASLQKISTDIMLGISKGVELINIFHGQTTAERDYYRGKVETDLIDRVAIGGTFKYSLMENVNNIYDTLYGGSINYRQCHVLGNFTSTLIPLMVKIANSGKHPHLTSDSTSGIQHALMKNYLHQTEPGGTLKPIAIGSRGPMANVVRTLPCLCPVCRVIKYVGVLGFGPHRYLRELLAIHNNFAMTRYAEGLQDFCLGSTKAEYNSHILSSVKRGSDYYSLQCALDFVDKVENESLVKARKHYNHLIHRSGMMMVPAPVIGDVDIPEQPAILTKAEIITLLSRLSKSVKELQ